MRPIGRSRNVVRMLAATLVPEHCISGHCGKLCRWSHLISSAEGQRNCLARIKSWVVLPNLSSISRPLCAIHRTQQILFSQTFEPNDLRLALPDFFLLMCAQGGHVRRTRLMIGSAFDTHWRPHKTGPSIQLDGTGYLHDLALQYMHRYSATFGKSFTRTNPSWLVNVSVWSTLCAWATPKIR